MGKWIATQKRNYKNNTQIMKDIEIKNQWKEFINKYKIYLMTNEELWYNTLQNVEEYINNHNKIPNMCDSNLKVKHLGKWISHQKLQYKKNIYIMKEPQIRQQWEEFIDKYRELF